MRRRTRPDRERGIAMMLCIFALLLLTAIGMGLLLMANTETAVNYNYRSSVQTYYASRAGLEEARERLRYGNAHSITPPWTIPSTSSPSGITYILNTRDITSDPVQPGNGANRYFDNELCNEPFYSGTFNALGLTPNWGVPCGTSAGPPAGSFTTVTSTDPGYNTPAALGYKWVRITLKQNCTAYYGVDGRVGDACIHSSNSNRRRLVCADPADMVNGIPREILAPAGTANCESASPALRSVYMITSLAAAARGARRMTQYEVTSAKLPPIPAAIVLAGANPAVTFPDSDMNTFDGNDHASGAGCVTGAATPAIGTVDSASTSYVVSLLPRPTKYTGVGSAPSVQQIGLNAAFSTVEGLSDLVSMVAGHADQSFGNNPTGVSLGTDTNPKVTYVNGDFTMEGSHGAGLLLVTGNLTINGNPDFNGIILAIGKGNVTIANNTNSAVFRGNMLIANLYDSSSVLLPPTSAPGQPTLTWPAGGSSAVRYDSCWSSRVASRLGFDIIAQRELMY